MPMAGRQSLRGSGEARRMVAAQVLAQPACRRATASSTRAGPCASRRVDERAIPGAGEAAGEGGQRRRQQRRPGQLHAARELPGWPRLRPRCPSPVGAQQRGRRGAGVHAEQRGHEDQPAAADDRIDAAGRTATPVRRGPVRSWRKKGAALAWRPFDCASATRDLLLRHLRSLPRRACCVSSVPSPSRRDFGGPGRANCGGARARSSRTYPELPAPKCAPASRAGPAAARSRRPVFPWSVCARTGSYSSRAPGMAAAISREHSGGVMVSPLAADHQRRAGEAGSGAQIGGRHQRAVQAISCAPPMRASMAR